MSDQPIEETLPEDPQPPDFMDPWDGSDEEAGEPESLMPFPVHREAKLDGGIISQAYLNKAHALLDKTTLHQEVDELRISVSKSKASLAQKEAEALLNGTNPGTNPEKRAAWNRQTFAEDYQAIADAEDNLQGLFTDESYLQLHLDLCNIEVERIEGLMKFIELEQAQRLISIQEYELKQKLNNVPIVPIQ